MAYALLHIFFKNRHTNLRQLQNSQKPKLNCEKLTKDMKDDYEEFHNCLTDLKEKEKKVWHIWIVQ